MRAHYLLAGCLTAAALSGCTKVYGPALGKMPVSDACTPALASRDCAPAFGAPYVILNDQAKWLPLVNGKPKVMDYLGRVLPVGDATGNPGIPCGNTLTPAFTEASAVPTYDDGQGGDVRIDRRQNFFQSRQISAAAKVDLVNALKAVPNVPANIDELVEADLDAAYSSLETVSVKAVGQFQQYQLSSEELDMLQVNDFSRVGDVARRAALEACRAQIWSPVGAAPRARMYQALTGFLVTSYEAESGAVRDIAASLAGKVRLQAPQADLATLQAALTQTSTEAVRTSARPLFVVVGVSFWQPVHIPSE